METNRPVSLLKSRRQKIANLMDNKDREIKEHQRNIDVLTEALYSYGDELFELDEAIVALSNSKTVQQLGGSINGGISVSSVERRRRDNGLQQ